jgi:hypothetical protein
MICPLPLTDTPAASSLPAHSCVLYGDQRDVAKPRDVAFTSMRCGNNPLGHDFLN